MAGYPPGSGPAVPFPIHTDVGYSSQSDIETGASAADYSDHEAGYSSAASNSFDFVPRGGYGASSARLPPAYAAARYGNNNSQSPPSMPAQAHFYHASSHSPLSSAPPGSSGSNTAADGASPAQGGQPGQPQYQRIARFVGPPPVALACTECRGRHLKCDAGVPACSRCVADKRECCYVKSRRGWKGTRRKKVAAAAAHAHPDQSAQSGTDTEGPEDGSSSAKPPPHPSTRKPSVTPPVPTGNFSPASHGPQTNPLETLRNANKNSTTFPSQQEPQTAPPATANLMQLFYAYFHSAHPFCLPPAYLIKTSAHQLTALLPVMRYIASFYAHSAPTETFAREAENALFGSAHPPPQDAFTVQALLLFAIGLHSDNDQERAAQVKDIAADLALELGMNLKEFSSAGVAGSSPESAVLEESWRRTWWELYFLDGMMAGVHQRDSFRLWSVECTVPLPCEEAQYMLGRIPEPHSLQEFDDRYFASDNTVFSSFAYRVEAMRILGQVLAVNTAVAQQQAQNQGQPQPEQQDDPRHDAADASIVNWGLHLPDKKKELINKDRRIDEMLFQAHMVINAATIYLHRPKSHLAFSLLQEDISCTPPTTWSTPCKPIALHTAKSISAANTISKLITLPTPLIKHTPFFSCVITLACVIHLSACSFILSGDEGFLAKERIRLGVGALKTLEEVWGIAAFVLGQVKFVSREVFRLPPPDGLDAFTASISEDEVVRFLNQERGIDIVAGDPDWHGLPNLEWDGN